MLDKIIETKEPKPALIGAKKSDYTDEKESKIFGENLKKAKEEIDSKNALVNKKKKLKKELVDDGDLAIAGLIDAKKDILNLQNQKFKHKNKSKKINQKEAAKPKTIKTALEEANATALNLKSASIKTENSDFSTAFASNSSQSQNKDKTLNKILNMNSITNKKGKKKFKKIELVDEVKLSNAKQTTNNQELKNEISKNNNIENMINNLLKTSTTKKPEAIEIEALYNKSKTEDTKIKDSFDRNIDVGMGRFEMLYRGAKSKEMLNSFSDALAKEIASYKPPITKINIDLNPKNLGSVEVVISKRGKDLQVSLKSNNEAMMIFVQNQENFKSNLDNLGFSNVDLAFSQNSGQNQQGKNHDEENAKNEESAQEQAQEGNLEISEVILTIPQYA